MLSTLHRCFSMLLPIVLCASLSQANPVVGPEMRICPTFSVAMGDQECVEIAAGSNGYLVVWDDTRGGSADIFACRLSATGQILDQSAIPISQYASEQSDPSVAWNGTEYLVVWTDRRSGVGHIYGARVRPDGQVIDKQGILISGTFGSQAYPKVASDGRGWQIVWQDSRGGSQDIYGCRMNGDGSFGKVLGIVTLAGNNEEMPDIAYNGTSFVVVWRDQRNSATTDADIYACRVARNGSRMVGDTLVTCDSGGSTGIAGAQWNPRITACGSGNCMVVWEDYRTGSSTANIYVARVNSSCVVMDRNGIPVTTGSGIREIPGISYDGIRLLVAWRDHTSHLIRGARVSTSGSVLDTSGLTISLGSAGSSGVGVCGCSGGGFQVGWNSLSMGGNEALAAWVPGTGSFAGSDGANVGLGCDNQANYSVADSGTEYAMVWSQKIDGKSCVMGARMSHAGVLLTPTAVNITATLAGQQTEPSIAWNGSEYLVAWCGDETYETTYLDIRGYRLDSSLHVKDTRPIDIGVISEDQTTPYVTSNGSKFLVVWEDSRNALAPTYYTDVFGAIVDAAGLITYIPAGINVSTGNQLAPRAASNGTDFYAVWEDWRAGYPLVYGVKVTATGTVASTTGTAMPATSYQQTTPDICFGGGYYFVTWADYSRISGCRLSTTATISDPSGIAVDTGSAVKNCPNARWDGSKYQVVWEDYRSQFAGNSDIYYTSVGPNGIVSTDPKTALVTDFSPQLKPRIFGDANSGVLFYSRYEAYTNSLCALPLTQQGVQEVASIAAAKFMPTGSLVLLRGKVVTAVFPDCFYAEDADRSSAVRVNSTVITHIGDIVDVTGVVGTSDGERQITTGSVTAMGSAGQPLRPFGMRGDMLGGAGLRSVVPGVTGAAGANNVGLLVKTWGKVTSTASGYFYIDSKPGTSIKVKSGTLTQPAVGKLVSVVGISTCEVSSGGVCRAVTPRQQTDIVVLQ